MRACAPARPSLSTRPMASGLSKRRACLISSGATSSPQPVVKPVCLQLDVEAQEAKQRAERRLLVAQIAEFRIDRPERAALAQPGHQGEGQLLVFVDLLDQRGQGDADGAGAAQGVAGGAGAIAAVADRDDRQLVRAERPAQPVTRLDRGHEQGQRGIVMGRQPAIDEQRRRLAFDNGDFLRVEIMRRGGRGAHDIGERIIFVADEGFVGGRFPEFRAGIVHQDPAAAGVDALQHDAEPGLQVRQVQSPGADDADDFVTQRLGVEFRLPSRKPEERLAKDARGHAKVKAADVGRGIAERERRGDDGAGGGAADQVEMIAQPDGAAMRAAKMASSRSRNPSAMTPRTPPPSIDRMRLRPSAEQMRLAGMIVGRRSAGRDEIAHPNSTFLTRNNWAQPAMSCIIAVVSANSVRPSS